MGIISKIISMLGGADGNRERDRDVGTTVTVEREPEAASERAVKGVDRPSTTVAKEEDGEEASGAARPTPTDEGEPVNAIKGIGAAYAEHLGDAGVRSVDDLAAADAEDLAEETGIGAGRLSNWIERAKARNR